jgi:hypothetical protein
MGRDRERSRSHEPTICEMIVSVIPSENAFYSSPMKKEHHNEVEGREFASTEVLMEFPEFPSFGRKLARGECVQSSRLRCPEVQRLGPKPPSLLAESAGNA